MDYRERYKKLVNSDWFKEIYHNKSLGDCPVEIPELCESENERIRNAIINLVKQSSEILDKSNQNRMLAWLEKQKEQDTNTKMVVIPKFVIHKFRVGDKVVSTRNRLLTYTILEVGIINELGNPEYKVEIFTDGKAGILNREHNIQNIEISRMDEWGELVEQKPAWSEEDEDTLDIAIRIIQNGGDDCSGILDSNKALNWLESLKDRVQPQPEQEWSEEDERMFESALWHVKNSCGNGGKDSGEFEVYNWLKLLKARLKPQPHWSPSREQLEALWDIIPHLPNCEEDIDKITNLSLLYDDLKTLCDYE